MKYELIGFSMADNGVCHAVVDNGEKRIYGSPACNRQIKTSGAFVKQLPKDVKFCGGCNRILPEFIVVEYQTGYSLLHARSGETHWLSDGVDVLFDKNENPISPGTKGFREKWEHEMNANYSETLEAYFPNLYDEENK